MSEGETSEVSASPKTTTVYVVFGPGNGYAHSPDMRDALKMASHMIAMDPLRLDALRADLIAGRKAAWGYGFESVLVVPQTWVQHLGKWYVVTASFPETELDAINRRISENHDSQACVLCVMDGIAYIASAHDTGVKSLTRRL